MATKITDITQKPKDLLFSDLKVGDVFRNSVGRILMKIAFSSLSLNERHGKLVLLIKGIEGDHKPIGTLLTWDSSDCVKEVIDCNITLLHEYYTPLKEK